MILFYLGQSNILKRHETRKMKQNIFHENEVKKAMLHCKVSIDLSTARKFKSPFTESLRNYLPSIGADITDVQDIHSVVPIDLDQLGRLQDTAKKACSITFPLIY